MSRRKINIRLFRDATGEYCLEIKAIQPNGNKYHMVHRFDTEEDRDDFLRNISLDSDY